MARYYSGSHQPLTNWNNIPIYLATILSAILAAGFVLVAVLGSMRSPLVLSLAFAMPLDPAWSLWRLFTYVIVNPISFFTPFAILCFYWWSVGIETHLGRERLATLVLLLVLIAPAMCGVWWVLGARTGAMGDYAFTGGLLVAFATLYPNTEAWGWIPFKWLAFACLACGSLMLLADRHYPALSQLWASCGAAFLYMRHVQESELDDYVSPFAQLGKWLERKPKLRVLPKPQLISRSPQEDSPVSEMDTLLD